jgi:outer membrane protein assembly factor BamB
MTRTAAIGGLLICLLALPLGHDAAAINLTYTRGDILVSLETGPVQWRLPDGTLNRVLAGPVVGTGEGMAFDASGNLYVSRWCILWCVGGNTVERYNASGLSQGSVGTGYDCSPHTIVFDAAGNAYVGQAGCAQTILKFAPGFAAPVAEIAAASEGEGVFWMDLAADNCTMFYTSFGPHVKAVDVCTGRQLPDLNLAPLPGGAAQDLRVLPEGGVLVSSGEVVVRLDRSGAVAQTYAAPLETFWAGLDLVGDGTFWVGSYESSNVYRFDLTTGAVVSVFNTATPTHTVVGVRVKR